MLVDTPHGLSVMGSSTQTVRGLSCSILDTRRSPITLKRCNMKLPDIFPASALLRVRLEGNLKKPGTVWLFWHETLKGPRDCVWVVKAGEKDFRFFDTAKGAEAYFVLSGRKKVVEEHKPDRTTKGVSFII